MAKLFVAILLIVFERHSNLVSSLSHVRSRWSHVVVMSLKTNENEPRTAGSGKNEMDGNILRAGFVSEPLS